MSVASVRQRISVSVSMPVYVCVTLSASACVPTLPESAVNEPRATAGVSFAGSVVLPSTSPSVRVTAVAISTCGQLHASFAACCVVTVRDPCCAVASCRCFRHRRRL